MYETYICMKICTYIIYSILVSTMKVNGNYIDKTMQIHNKRYNETTID